MRAELFFELGDKAGKANFIAWHHARHHSYDLLSSRAGKTLPPIDLTGEINSDWLHRHLARHITHRRLMGIFTTSHLAGLADLHIESHSGVADWLLRHALEHQALDKFYKLP